MISRFFKPAGVRQGGVLSPLLFAAGRGERRRREDRGAEGDGMWGGGVPLPTGGGADKSLHCDATVWTGATARQ